MDFPRTFFDFDLVGIFFKLTFNWRIIILHNSIDYKLVYNVLGIQQSDPAGKESASMQETPVQLLGWEYPLEKE